VFADERGFFYESWNSEKFRAAGIDQTWKQDNHARSCAKTLRGLHFQSGKGQAKLVRCTLGRIWDAAVDIRPDSPTFRMWFGMELNEANRKMLLIPAGFAHGYCVLSETSEVLYKCSTVYDAALESEFAWNDPQVGIKWPVDDPLLSPRDSRAQSFEEYIEKTVTSSR
jgi:dTDP-4-dehydrorhamnose 3,5-epimerase